jgi:hypothetical protein
MRVTADSCGNIYVVGYTYGTFPSQTSYGFFDAFLAKFDSAGNLLWVRQFGSSRDDFAHGLAVDGEGNIYVSGGTGGTLPGQTSFGLEDIFLAKYDRNGNLLWLRQFGTSTNDNDYCVAVDPWSNVYVVGHTGTSPQAPPGSQDILLAKFDSSGNMLWMKRFGTENDDYNGGVAVDSYGNAYVAGFTLGTFPGQTSFGLSDFFLVKFDSSGRQLWVKQFGTSREDAGGYGVIVDKFGNVYITGLTRGTFPGQISLGGSDAFHSKILHSS